ncbi:MAG: PRC-barrel domain containing protein [Phycisphaerae bacterium]
MLLTLNNLMGTKLDARDDTLGKVKDFYFDDHSWVVRYLVADTGDWLPGRQVLISTESFEAPQGEQDAIPVSLTREQIESSPPIHADRPVSREREAEMIGHYNWPMYWTHLGVPAVGMMPVGVAPESIKEEKTPLNASDIREVETTLRSVREVTGYHILAKDGELGHVEGLIADPADWRIRYLLVDTRNWLPGRKVLIAPDWAGGILWSQKQVQIDLPTDKIRSAPEYDPDQPITREYERSLFDHYGMRHYWEGASAVQ